MKTLRNIWRSPEGGYLEWGLSAIAGVLLAKKLSRS